MRALTTIPRQPDTAELQELPEPQVPEGWLLVETLAIGVCGTDREILDGSYGEAPPGRQRLVLGHECLARVRNAPAGSGFATGDSGWLARLITTQVALADWRHALAGESDGVKTIIDFQ